MPREPCQAQDVLYFGEGSSGNVQRLNVDFVEDDFWLCISPSSNTSQSTGKDQERGSDSDIDSSGMATETMVCGVNQNDNSFPCEASGQAGSSITGGCDSQQPAVSPVSSMANMRDKLRKQGVPEKAKETMLRARASGTRNTLTIVHLIPPPLSKHFFVT